MRVGIIGINHKSADVVLREKLGKAFQKRFSPGFSAHPQMSYVLLCTCNRLELYFSSQDLAETHTYLLGVLRSEISEEFEHRLYSYFGYDCFFHLSCVTSGLDSAIIGETEIQGQVKNAYEMATEYYSLSKELHFLFQKSLKIGKEVRSSSQIFLRKNPTLEEAIFSTANRLLGPLEKRKILFVGASEINKKLLLQFKKRGLKEITFCNRSALRSQVLAENEKVKWLPWEKLKDLIYYDLIVFGTKSHDYLLSQVDQLQAHKVIIDLSVPRNVHPAIGKNTFITLLNIDELHAMIDPHEQSKAMQLARLEMQSISHAVKRQTEIFHIKELYQFESLISAH